MNRTTRGLGVWTAALLFVTACGGDKKPSTMPDGETSGGWTEPVPEEPGPAATTTTTEPTEPDQAPVQVSTSGGLRDGMYVCGFGGLNDLADELRTHPCVVQTRADGTTTLEKLRGFDRFKGEVTSRTTDSFTVAGQSSWNFGKAAPTSVAWTFTRTRGDYWASESADPRDSLALDRLGDELEYGGDSYGAYKYGDSSKD